MEVAGNDQLNQWGKTDRIQMEGFNADNSKVEQAPAGLAAKDTALEALISKCGI